LIRKVEQPFGFTLIRLAYGHPPSPVRGKARTMALTELHSSLDSRTDKPSPPWREKVAPPEAVTDEGETHSFLYFTN